MKSIIVLLPVAWVLSLAGVKLSKISYMPRAWMPYTSNSLPPEEFVWLWPAGCPSQFRTSHTNLTQRKGALVLTDNCF